MAHYEAELPKPAGVSVSSSKLALWLSRIASVTWIGFVERSSNAGSGDFVSETAQCYLLSASWAIESRLRFCGQLCC